jgi:hypothetical protein
MRTIVPLDRTMQVGLNLAGGLLTAFVIAVVWAPARPQPTDVIEREGG